MGTKTPWAVLLCKWKNTTDEPKTINFFKRLFTADGIGSRNMVDFFDQMSHGAVDLSGSKVFGWYDLKLPQTAYVGNVEDSKVPAGQINRQGLVNLARQTATDNKVDLSAYYGVVVCMNTPTDLFGGGGIQALCDPGSFEPSALGQEMGHGYGMEHSRRDGSTADYQDPWDIMTTFDSAFMAPHAEYTEIGPGLNAANMRGRGWLDETRVWNSSSGTSTDIVRLRPLHRRDLSGFLAADVLGLDGTRYLFEFRPKAGWDAQFNRSAVLIHRLEDNHSYLMSGRSGAPDLVAGDAFEQGNGTIAAASHLLVEVLSINEAAKTATLRITRRRGRIERLTPIRQIEGLGRFDPGGVVGSGGPVDGGAWVIIGGRVIHIPVWNPMAAILEQVAVYQGAEVVPDADLKTTVRQRALRSMAGHAASVLERTPTFRVPAPRTGHEESPPPKHARDTEGADPTETGGERKATPRQRRRDASSK